MMFHLPKFIFRDELCITGRDDTPMDASSVSEEDIIEICITKGHTHPLGLLCYATMESVVLFCSMDKLQCATCGIVKVMELQGEAITVKAMAPSEAHIKAYFAMSCSNPSNGEGSHNTPPQQTPPSGGTTASAPSGTWRPCQPWAVTAHGGPNTRNYTITQPLQIHGYAHWEVGTLRRMTRRSPFQEGGRWGPLRQPTPPTEPEQSAGGRVPSGPPHKHHALLHLGQIWGN